MEEGRSSHRWYRDAPGGGREGDTVEEGIHEPPIGEGVVVERDGCADILVQFNVLKQVRVRGFQSAERDRETV